MTSDYQVCRAYFVLSRHVRVCMWVCGHWNVQCQEALCAAGKDADRNEVLLAWGVLMAVQWGEPGLLYQTDSGLCHFLTV